MKTTIQLSLIKNNRLVFSGNSFKTNHYSNTIYYNISCLQYAEIDLIYVENKVKEFTAFILVLKTEIQWRLVILHKNKLIYIFSI